jgi:large subunit ribosomal protein L15
VEYAIVNFEQLASFDVDMVIDLVMLQERGIAKKGRSLLKVLANGELATAVTVKAHKFSASAAAKIAAAGGTAELIEN